MDVYWIGGRSGCTYSTSHVAGGRVACKAGESERSWLEVSAGLQLARAYSLTRPYRTTTDRSGRRASGEITDVLSCADPGRVYEDASSIYVGRWLASGNQWQSNGCDRPLGIKLSER